MQTLLTQVDPGPHGVHAEVHRALLASLAQLLSGHRWKLASQAGTQAVPSQVTLPLVGAVQVVQVGPQASAVLLATQVGAVVVPRRQ